MKSYKVKALGIAFFGIEFDVEANNQEEAREDAIPIAEELFEAYSMTNATAKTVKIAEIRRVYKNRRSSI